MVQAWSTEPSKELRGCTALQDKHHGQGKFSETVRFARDGTNLEGRISNFVNGRDPQGMESHAHRVDIDTNTHTTYEDRLATTRNVVAMAEQMEKSLWSPPAMKSQRVKSATNKSYICNDTRFEKLADSSNPEIGPGHYWIEGGLPDMGTLPAFLPSRGSSPARDPGRQSAAFISPPRGELFRRPDSPGKVYVSPNFKAGGSGHSPGAGWRCTCPEGRPDVRDYRYNTRFHDAMRKVPWDAEYPAGEGINQSSQLIRVADSAAAHTTGTASTKLETRTQHGGSSSGSNSPRKDMCKSTSAFRSKEARLSKLPPQRLNDVRLSRGRWDEDPEALGPGSYTPLISLGSAKRKTYRLFTPGSQNGAQPGFTRGSTSANNAAFSTTSRSRKTAPFTINTDSSLTKTH